MQMHLDQMHLDQIQMHLDQMQMLFYVFLRSTSDILLNYVVTTINKNTNQYYYNY